MRGKHVTACLWNLVIMYKVNIEMLWLVWNNEKWKLFLCYCSHETVYRLGHPLCLLQYVFSLRWTNTNSTLHILYCVYIRIQSSSFHTKFLTNELIQIEIRNPAVFSSPHSTLSLEQHRLAGIQKALHWLSSWKNTHVLAQMERSTDANLLCRSNGVWMATCIISDIEVFFFK
jgi:hypothetical protein